MRSFIRFNDPTDVYKHLRYQAEYQIVFIKPHFLTQNISVPPKKRSKNKNINLILHTNKFKICNAINGFKKDIAEILSAQNLRNTNHSNSSMPSLSTDQLYATLGLETAFQDNGNFQDIQFATLTPATPNAVVTTPISTNIQAVITSPVQAANNVSIEVIPRRLSAAISSVEFEYPDDEELRLIAKGTSGPLFAGKLLLKILPVESLINKKVYPRGSKSDGKTPLELHHVEYIKRITLQFYQIAESSKDAFWATCVTKMNRNMCDLIKKGISSIINMLISP